MSDEKFEEAKKEIRSLLISYQKGCSLSEFRREYPKIIGRPLPFKEFKYKDEVSLLYAMPDAVRVSATHVPGDYHLMGVADASVAHIQKMVCKQKPTKHKISYRMPKSVPRSYQPSRLYALPPRFVRKELPPGVAQHVFQLLEYYYHGLSLNHFMKSFLEYYGRYFTYRDWGYLTVEECLGSIPGLQVTYRGNEIFVCLANNMMQQKVKDKPAASQLPKNSSRQGSAPQSSYSTVQASNMSKSNTNIDYFDRDFNRKASGGINASKESFQPTPKVTTKDNSLLNKFMEDSQNQNSGSQGSTKQLHDDSFPTQTIIRIKTAGKSKADTLDNFQLIDFREKAQKDTKTPLPTPHKHESKIFDFLDPTPMSFSGSFPAVSENIRCNVRKVMEHFPHGIFAVDFPGSYEKVTQVSFDLQSLGFIYLAEFVNALPDIIVQKTFNGSKKDWLIYPVNISDYASNSDMAVGKSGLLFTECVILNTRKILQAFSEGINLNEFTHMYSVNCNEPLYIRDLGFDNIENFLLSIAQRVPLKIVTDCDFKVVYIDEFEEVIKPPVAPVQETSIPSDVASPNVKFKKQELPADFDYSKYFPMYTSSINNPGLLYIQLHGEETSEALQILSDDMEEFYNKEISKMYVMRRNDVKVDTACVALWPTDGLWYRAQIISDIIAQDFVRVFYVDYGTRDQIPLDMLRYIKKEYVELPAQALKSCLAYMKPPKSTTYHKSCRLRMLEMCQNMMLMAHIENIDANGVYSLILCDTNKDEDVHINDVLVREGYAIFEDCEESPPEPLQTPDQLQKSQQEALVQVLTAAFKSPDFCKMVQNTSLNNSCASAAAGFTPQPKPPSFPSLAQQQPVNNMFQNPAVINFMNPIPPPVNPFSMPVQSISGVSSIIAESNDYYAENSSPEEADVFASDDDEEFEQFYQKISSGKKCFIKRVKTGDGYIFHVLLYDSRPFVSVGDISVLIWSTQNPMYLVNRLRNQAIELPSVTLLENENEEFFAQLLRFSVKGIEKGSDDKSTILMFPLENVNQILNLFGHPSVALRAKIVHEYINFNPSSPQWQEYPDSEVPEEIEEVRSVTDDDKLNRLCLNDLKTMKEGIRYKKLKLTKSLSGEQNLGHSVDEIRKLDQLYCKVRDRIQEIEEICNIFPNNRN